MRHITDTTITIRPPGSAPREIPVADLLQQIAESVGQGGIPLAEQRKRFRILDAIDAGRGGTIDLEDADHKLLSDLCEAMPWAWVDRAWIQLASIITEAPK